MVQINNYKLTFKVHLSTSLKHKLNMQVTYGVLTYNFETAVFVFVIAFVVPFLSGASPYPYLQPDAFNTFTPRFLPHEFDEAESPDLARLSVAEAHNGTDVPLNLDRNLLSAGWERVL